MKGTTLRSGFRAGAAASRCASSVKSITTGTAITSLSGGTPRCWPREVVQEKQTNWNTTIDRKTFLAARLQRRFLKQPCVEIFVWLIPLFEM
jgi:hypothetical protein